MAPRRFRGGAFPERGRQFDSAVSLDGKQKAFYRDYNLYLGDAEGQNAVAITTEGSEKTRIKYGSASWVYGEELNQNPAMWWSPDSKNIYFSWKGANEILNEDTATYEVNADCTGLRKLTEEEARLTPPANGDVSNDKKTAVYADSGDIFLYNLQTGERRQITKTTEIETNPRFIRDDRHITFVRQNNLYSFSLDSGMLEQLTDIRAPGAGGGPNPDARKGPESQESLKKEALDLLAVIRERAKKP